MSELSKLIFCFNNGNLVRRLLVQADEEDFYEDLFQKLVPKLVPFYSFKTFVIHYKYLLNLEMYTEAEKIKDLFMTSHSFSSLRNFLKQSFSKNNSVIRDHNDSTSFIKKSIVVTNSKYSSLGLEEREILISELKEKGSGFLKNVLIDLLKRKTAQKNILIHFNSKRSKSHFLFLCNQLEGWISELKNENHDIFGCLHMVLVVYKSASAISDIEFISNNWHYQVIENLHDSFYQENMKFLGKPIVDCIAYFEEIMGNQFVKEMFFQNLEQIDFKKRCRDLVRNQLIPVLSKISESDLSNEAWQIVNFMHQSIMERIDFTSLGLWDEILFKSDSHRSVKEILFESTSREYSLELKKMILKLKKHHSLGFMISMNWIPVTYKKQLINLFRQKLSNDSSDRRYIYFFKTNY